MIIQSVNGFASTETLKMERYQTGSDEWLTSVTTARQGRFIILSTVPLPTTTPLDMMVFACPNGNTAEQTLGDTGTSGTRWRYGIQHIAAQWRYWRSQDAAGKSAQVLVCVEAPKLSWPTAVRLAPPELVLGVFETIRPLVSPAARFRHLAAHSGGGALLHAVIAAETTPTLPQVLPEVQTLSFLDANYAFQHSTHGAALGGWLQNSEATRLTSLTYDDRNVVLDGKPIVGPTGGTLRANMRMVDSLTTAGVGFNTRANSAGTTEAHGLEGRLRLETLPNPNLKVLHTVLVEKNGLLHALIPGTDQKWMQNPLYRSHIRPLLPADAQPLPVPR